MIAQLDDDYGLPVNQSLHPEGFYPISADS